jgi:hypothetical protein
VIFSCCGLETLAADEAGGGVGAGRGVGSSNELDATPECPRYVFFLYFRSFRRFFVEGMVAFQIQCFFNTILKKNPTMTFLQEKCFKLNNS